MNYDDDEHDDDDGFADTQETMTQNELTQMADSLDDSASFLSPSIGSKSRQREESPPRINLRNVPWARLIPCSELGNASVRIGAVAAAGLQGANTGGGGGGDANSGANSPASAAVDGGFCRNDATGITLYPRDPLTGSGARSGPQESNGTPTRRNPAGRSFLGLPNLQPSDRFNECVVGRSLKCDLITKVQQKESVDGEQAATSEVEDEDRAAAAAKKRDRNSEWVHSTISNKHCKIFCHLKAGAKGGGGGGGAGGGAGGAGSRGHFAGIANQGEEMEVYIEDTSGNGTAINNTTVLRRGERRVLHTGDEICLLNPDTMRKQSNAIGTEEQGRLVKHYSYIFVNLYQQRGQHTLALGGEFGMRGPVQASGGGGYSGNNRRAVYASGGKVTPKAVVAGAASSGVSSSAKRRGVVDVRAIKTSQDMDDRAVMPPPPSAQRKAGGGASSGGGGSGKFFSAVINQASAAGEKRSRQLAQAQGQNQAQPPAPSQKYPQQQPQQPPPPPRPRLVQDHYDVRDHLGSGTCGEVRRAIHRRTGREYAIKIIPTSNRGGRMAAMKLQMSDAAIKAEAAILQALDHPYIVKLADVFVAPNQAVYLVMELLHGGDLFDRIVEKEKYEEAEARKVMRRILAALHYLHETKEICHRDLKPENILMVGHSDDITVKLTDFGLAKSVTEEGLKTFCGTPSYIAPEVLKRRHTVAGQGRYGQEADMWSIGVILYILLSGTPPFDTSGSIDNVFDARISFDDDRGWYGVSDAAKDLVRRLLVNNPIQRLSVADACNHAWILQEDGDTHCHPLEDPAVEGVERPKPKPVPAASLGVRNTTASGGKASESRQSRLQFSQSSTPSAVNRAQPQSSATQKASKGPVQQAPARRLKQERLKPIPILKSATKAKRPNKNQTALSIIAEEAARPSPRSIAGGNTSTDDSSGVDVSSSCKTTRPTSELPDDEILSDFSDEEDGNVSKPKKSSWDKVKASNECDCSNDADKETGASSKANSGQKLVQKTLDGKTAPSPAHGNVGLVRSASADSTSSTSGKRKREDGALNSNPSSGISPDAPSSGGSKKVQRTLFGKVASPQLHPPPEVTDGPDTTDDEKAGGNNSADNTPECESGGKKQKTLASWFQGKASYVGN